MDRDQAGRLLDILERMSKRIAEQDEILGKILKHLEEKDAVTVEQKDALVEIAANLEMVTRMNTSVGPCLKVWREP